MQKPRLSAYAAFQKEGDRLKDAMRRMSFGDANSEVSKEWKSMSDSEKKK